MWSSLSQWAHALRPIFFLRPSMSWLTESVPMQSFALGVSFISDHWMIILASIMGVGMVTSLLQSYDPMYTGPQSFMRPALLSLDRMFSPYVRALHDSLAVLFSFSKSSFLSVHAPEQAFEEHADPEYNAASDRALSVNAAQVASLAANHFAEKADKSAELAAKQALLVKQYEQEAARIVGQMGDQQAVLRTNTSLHSDELSAILKDVRILHQQMMAMARTHADILAMSQKKTFVCDLVPEPVLFVKGRSHVRFEEPSGGAEVKLNGLSARNTS